MIAALLALLGLGLAGGVVAAHLARRRARREVVGSLRLLRAAAGTASTRRVIPRLKHKISLALVLAAIAVLVTGMALDGCGSRAEGRLLLVVDGGSGMGRLTEAGDSVLDVARGRLASGLSSMGATSFAVVVAGETGRVPVGLTSDPGLALRAIDEVVPVGRADLAGALALADVLCEDPDRDEILLISEGLAAAPSTRCPVRRLDLPAAEPGVGIASLVARSTDGLGLIEAVVAIAGDRDVDSEVEVELRLDGQVVDAFSVLVPPRGQVTSVRRVTGPGERLVAELVGTEHRAEVGIGSIEPLRVGLITDRPEGLLATALQLHPGAVVEVVDPESSQDLDDVQLSILEVGARPPPVGAIVLVGEAVRTAGLQDGDPLETPRITRWAFDDPLLRFVELDELVLRRATPLQVPGSGASLIEAGGRPIAIRGELSGRPMVAMGFSVADSDLALRVDFLHLLANLIEWASPAPAARAGLAQHDPGRGEMAPSTEALDALDVMTASGSAGLPWWMWGVIGAIGLLLIEIVVAVLRPWRRISIGRKIAAHGVRAGVLLVLVLSLSGLQLIFPGGTARTVFVVDGSASVGEGGYRMAQERYEALASTAPGETALVRVDQAPVVVRDGVWPERGPDPVAASDLGAGVQAALGLIDPSAGGRVVLISDGADTRGDLSQALETARQRRVPVDIVSLPEASGDPALLGLELTETVVRPGETVEGVAILRGPAEASSARVEVSIDGEVVSDALVEVGAGRVRHRFEVEVPTPGRAGGRRLGVRMIPAGPDEEPGNNSRSIGITVGEPPTLLALAGDPRELDAMRRAVEAEGMRMRVRLPSEVVVDDLRDADLVIIGDVAVEAEESGEEVLSPELIEAIRPWVSEGGGLITLGGDHTYELGGWSDTPLATVLPLDISAKAEDLEPAVTLVQILDNSASMGDWSGYQTKMALANEGAVASMRVLRPRDSLAVLAVNTAVDRVVPVQPVTDPLRLSAAIRSIKPGGGGIYTYTSLMAADRIVRDAETPLQHVVLYADAQDAEEMVRGIPFGFGPGPTAFQVAKRIRGRGATLSVIALGDPRDQHVGFLQDLARLGGGRFRITREPGELRALFVEETREVVRTVVQDVAFSAEQVAEHPTLEGVDIEGAPALLGFVEVEARETADVLLTGPDDKPILTTWQYGLGHVAAWSTDLGPRWGERWIAWDDYSRLVVQQVRWALRPPTARGAGIEVRPHHDGVGVTVTRYDDEGLALPDQGVRGKLVADGAELPVDLRLVEPGLWVGSAAAPIGSAHSFVLEDAATGKELARQAVVVPEGLEREVGTSDAVRTTPDVTGGELDPDTLGAPSAGLGAGQPLGWWLVLLALLLIPVDAWVRVPVRG